MTEFFCPDKSSISPNYTETARYLGYKKSNPPDETISALIKRAASELQPALAPQTIFEQFDICLDGPTPTLHFADVTFTSADLSRNLAGCNQVILFAATLGPKVDSIIRRTQKTDSAYAAVLQATGAMFIEELVEMLCEQIKKEAESQGKTTRPRFSPGYGDVPLSIQKDFFRLLPCTKIGLTLMDSLIMAPEKSVTAFIGITSK